MATAEQLGALLSAFKRTMRSVNEDAYNLLARVENEVVVDEGELAIQYKAIDVHAYSANFYDLMCQACRGEALAVIRTVDDMKGLAAWNKLHKTFNPRAFARVIDVAVPHRLRLLRRDFETHGFSPNCLGCKALILGAKPFKGHRADCRERMERILQGTERSESHKKRELEYFEKAFDREECKRHKLANADRGAEYRTGSTPAAAASPEASGRDLHSSSDTRNDMRKDECTIVGLRLRRCVQEMRQSRKPKEDEHIKEDVTVPRQLSMTGRWNSSKRRREPRLCSCVFV